MFFLLTTALLSSCRKDQEDPVNPQPPASTAYSFPVTDGSYWLYIQEQTDPSGNITQTGHIDSVYVDGDTVIGANTYKRIRTYMYPGAGWFPYYGVDCVRDSAGYLVHPDGSFIEHDNFTDTLAIDSMPGYYVSYFFMRHADSIISVPAGSFTTIDYERTVYHTFPTYPYPSPRHTHNFLANGIGKVKEVKYYFSQPGYIQRRLVSYHIQ